MAGVILGAKYSDLHAAAKAAAEGAAEEDVVAAVCLAPSPYMYLSSTVIPRTSNPLSLPVQAVKAAVATAVEGSVMGGMIGAMVGVMVCGFLGAKVGVFPHVRQTRTVASVPHRP
jgi:hypothetical protein